MAQRLLQDYFPEGTVIDTWEDVLNLLGVYQIDEGLARSKLLFNIANALSAINTLPLHGTLNSRKNDFVTEEYVLIYFELVKDFNRLHHEKVQTFEQGRDYARTHKDKFSKLYKEMFRFQDEDRSAISIDLDRVKKLSRESGMPELNLPLVDVPWSSLKPEEQERHRLNMYRTMHDYYSGWNPNGYAATILSEKIEEMDDKKPAAV